MKLGPPLVCLSILFIIAQDAIAQTIPFQFRSSYNGITKSKKIFSHQRVRFKPKAAIDRLLDTTLSIIIDQPYYFAIERLDSAGKKHALDSLALDQFRTVDSFLTPNFIYTFNTIEKISIYEEEAEKFGDIADSLRRVAEQKYEEGIRKLDRTNIDVYKAGFKTLNAELSAAMVEVKRFDNLKESLLYQSNAEKKVVRAFFVANASDAQNYFEGSLADSKTKFLNNTLLSYSADGGKASLYNELFSDYAGPIRLGLGVLVGNKQSPPGGEKPDSTETSKDAIQRLLGGGGNASLNLSYPLIDIHGGEHFFAKLGVAPKFGLDIPKLGTEKSDYAFNYNIGLEGSIFYTGALNVFTFFANFRTAYLGGNNIFYENLGESEQKEFWMNQLSLGLGITNTFRLSYSFYGGSDFVSKNFPGSVSFIVIP